MLAVRVGQTTDLAHGAQLKNALYKSAGENKIKLLSVEDLPPDIQQCLADVRGSSVCKKYYIPQLAAMEAAG